MDRLSFAQADLVNEPMLHIYINGQNLIDLVRDVELPFATAEGAPQIAGKYSGIPSRIALQPSQYLLGELGEFAYFNACGEEKRTLLTCTCGQPGCWSLCARVEVKDLEVIWSDFSNRHRTSGSRIWLYESFGPFYFDKQQYIKAVQSGIS